MTDAPQTPRGPRRRPGPPPNDGRQQHLNWLSMVEITGPFLTLPVLREAWPTLDALEAEARDALRAAHAAWQAEPADPQSCDDWIRYVLGDLLEWGETLETDAEQLRPLVPDDNPDHPSFALVAPGEPVKPDTTRLLGLTCPPGTVPTALRRASDEDSDDRLMAPADRLARLCRRNGVELGLSTDGRWWTLVWAPVGGVTGTATFDAATWPEQADRDVVRAFRSLLRRARFFAVPDDEMLVPLLRRSLDNQEEVTEALGVQVRRAVELLVDAIGRADARAAQRDASVLADIPAQDIYRGAVSVMMRIVFLLFAEERGLLPSDNTLYAQAYSAGRLCDDLEQAVRDSSEENLEHSSAGWLRLLALFQAVHGGVNHPRLPLPAYDGSLFDSTAYPWFAEVSIDDRTVLHMLQAVQYVVIGRERRRLSFRALDVEQIGYVYEGLLSFEGRRAATTVVGLIGRQGAEEEVALTELEAHAAAAPKPADLAARLAEAYKDSRIGTPVALARRLEPLPEGERAEALRRLLAATDNDLRLAERLLPFAGIIRTDLRGLPVVIAQDALYVTESPLRRNTGTHYTPRKLAEEIVEGALEPLVYSPGPLDTADRTQWQPRSSDEILALRIADIAMGSGAFLVGACRYLADHLIKAWAREGRTDGRLVQDDGYGEHAIHDTEADPLVIQARRDVIQHCLYGVDINPMATEMAKLSLWLISMDPERPFTFLDDRLVTGDSLLGITSLEQLEYMHLDPAEGRALHKDSMLDFLSGVRTTMSNVAKERRKLASRPSDNLNHLAAKREVLVKAASDTEQVRLFADLVVGAALASARRAGGSSDPRAREDAERERERGSENRFLAAAWLANEAARSNDLAKAKSQVRQWLAADLPGGASDRHPLHWPLEFPEVFEHGGFHAIIGNPPFLGGQKLTGTLGIAYREHLVGTLANSVRGIADLVAFFLLRAHGLLYGDGQCGMIATNTLAQGDTRTVGLDQVVMAGSEIRQAIKSEPWPSRSAALQYCAVWTTLRSPSEAAPRTLDGRSVTGITTSLDSMSRARGNPQRLASNEGSAFIGTYILSMGFTLEPDEAAQLIRRDARNGEVLSPYLNGQDLNSRPDCSASRWVIDFHDWPLERAQTYPDCFSRVDRLVKPERLQSNDQTARKYWWRFLRPRPELKQAIEGLDRVVVITRVSRSVTPVLVSAKQVISERIVVFATDDAAALALLSSGAHYWWFMRDLTMHGGAADPQYSARNYETFPHPEALSDELRRLGKRLDVYRREVTLARHAGLTATYNIVNDRTGVDSDVEELRRIHVAIDEEVARCYGWEDLDLDHGFHETRQGVRFTVGPAARQEILDRMLELNHDRYAAEVMAGLHAKKKGKSSDTQEGLF